MADKNDEIFSGTTFSSLLKDIYENSSKKRKQIDILVNELRPLIKDVAQATMVVPLIKEYMEVSVKNDEQLIKMASVYQKYIASEEKLHQVQEEHGSLLTEEEKKQLLSDIKKDVTATTSDIIISECDVKQTMDSLENKSTDIVDTIKDEEQPKE